MVTAPKETTLPCHLRNTPRHPVGRGVVPIGRVKCSIACRAFGGMIATPYSLSLAGLRLVAVVRSAFVPHCAFPSLGRYDPPLTDPVVPRSLSVIAGRHRAAGLIHAATINESPCLRQPITLTSLRSFAPR